MVYTVTVTQRNVFEIDDEDEEVQEYLKTGGSIREYVAEHYIWDETLGTYSCDIDVDQWKDLGELK
jgi:hypothetical protein